MNQYFSRKQMALDEDESMTFDRYCWTNRGIRLELDPCRMGENDGAVVGTQSDFVSGTFDFVFNGSRLSFCLCCPIISLSFKDLMRRT